MAEPEAPQRDRWEDAAAGAIERADFASDGTGPVRALEQPHLRRCIAAALRAAYQQGQKDEREACAMLAESVLGDAAFLSSPCDHGTPCQYCLPDAIRSRAQEETKR